MLSTSISTLTDALFLAAVLTGCAVAPYDDTYYDGPYFEGPYNGAPYHGGRIYRYGDIYLAYPHPRRHRQASPHRKQMQPLEILLLIVDPGTNANTIRDHIDAFTRFSRHRIFVLNKITIGPH